MPLPITTSRRRSWYSALVTPGRSMSVVISTYLAGGAGTRFARAVSSVLHQPKIDNQVTSEPERRQQLQLNDRSAFDVLHDPQWHVNIAPGSDREVPHRYSVAHQHNGDQLISGVAAAEVERLADHSVRDEVAQVGADRDRLVKPGAFEGVNALQETVLGDH